MIDPMTSDECVRRSIPIGSRLNTSPEHLLAGLEPLPPFPPWSRPESQFSVSFDTSCMFVSCSRSEVRKMHHSRGGGRRGSWRHRGRSFDSSASVQFPPSLLELVLRIVILGSFNFFSVLHQDFSCFRNAYFAIKFKFIFLLRDLHLGAAFIKVNI